MPVRERSNPGPTCPTSLVDPRADLAGAALEAISAMRELCAGEGAYEGSLVRIKAASVLLTAWSRVCEAEELGKPVPPGLLPKADRLERLRQAIVGSPELREGMRELRAEVQAALDEKPVPEPTEVKP